jgi:hypothetical protein
MKNHQANPETLTLGEALKTLQRLNVAVWIAGSELGCLIPQSANAGLVRLFLRGNRAIIYEYLYELREERAGILMDSGASFETATAQAENQIKLAALREAHPYWDEAIKTMESIGESLGSISNPEGNQLWNSAISA